ncbi:hypothetical protein FRC10_005271 [Ceratobasidium sp. 414]|nr:hypothetical protein FRC10_005271 [Ceratobasidium sp. 414]
MVLLAQAVSTNAGLCLSAPQYTLRAWIDPAPDDTDSDDGLAVGDVDGPETSMISTTSITQSIRPKVSKRSPDFVLVHLAVNPGTIPQALIPYTPNFLGLHRTERIPLIMENKRSPSNRQERPGPKFDRRVKYLAGHLFLNRRFRNQHSVVCVATSADKWRYVELDRTQVPPTFGEDFDWPEADVDALDWSVIFELGTVASEDAFQDVINICRAIVTQVVT